MESEVKLIEIDEAEYENLLLISEKYSQLSTIGTTAELIDSITNDLKDFDKTKMAQADGLIKRQAQSTDIAEKLDLAKQISKILEMTTPTVEQVMKNYQRLVLVNDKLFIAPATQFSNSATTGKSVGTTGKKSTIVQTGDVLRLCTGSVVSDEMTILENGQLSTGEKASMEVFNHKAEVAGQTPAEYLETHNYKGRANEPGFSYGSWQIKVGDTWHNLNGYQR
jgi:DNA-binding CsgD family transcriptional regulator